MGFFSKNINLSMPAEIIYHLSQWKLDGEGRKMVFGHILQVLQFCHSDITHCKEVIGRLFTLALEGHVRQWCHTLPIACIHSFEKLISELRQVFNRCNFQNVFKRIN